MECPVPVHPGRTRGHMCKIQSKIEFCWEQSIHFREVSGKLIRNCRKCFGTLQDFRTCSGTLQEHNRNSTGTPTDKPEQDQKLDRNSNGPTGTGTRNDKQKEPTTGTGTANRRTPTDYGRTNNLPATTIQLCDQWYHKLGAKARQLVPVANTHALTFETKNYWRGRPVWNCVPETDCFTPVQCSDCGGYMDYPWSHPSALIRDTVLKRGWSHSNYVWWRAVFAK
jgi:hypothetical protein